MLPTGQRVTAWGGGRLASLFIARPRLAGECGRLSLPATQLKSELEELPLRPLEVASRAPRSCVGCRPQGHTYAGLWGPSRSQEAALSCLSSLVVFL